MTHRQKQKSDHQSSTSRLAELEQKLARALADYHNLEKRFNQESAQIIKFANRELLRKLLDLRDNLERAAQSIQDQGVNLVLAQLDKILEEEKVKEIVALHQEFDPNLMEAEEVVAGKANQVVAVTRKGYLHHDRLLRPAKVKVGSGQESSKIKMKPACAGRNSKISTDKQLSTNN